MDISIFSWIFAGIAVILTLLIWYSGRNDDYWKKRGVPHLPRRNFFASLYSIKKKGMSGIIKEIALSKLGRVYGSFEGSKPIVIVTDPDLLRDILVKDFHVFPYRRVSNIGDPVADSIVMNRTGDDWKRVRTIITPAFTSKRMRQIGSIINDCSKSVLEVCEQHWEKKEPVDCKGLFGAFTMDVISNSAFGTKVDSHKDPQNEFVRRVRDSFLKISVTIVTIFFLIPSWVFKIVPPSINPMKMDKDDFFRDVVRSVVAKRKEKGTRYNDFLQIMMDAADEAKREEHLNFAEDETDRFGSIVSNGLAPPTQKYKKLSETELLAQCVLFFLVGYETTATVLTFTAYSLATNPEWQEKLIKEVDEAFEKHSEMSYDSVRDMKILDAVVSETLRMHPPLASTERAAVEDYELGNTGILVEKGMHVLIPLYGMHYDPEFFEDPETFNPERFMDSSEPKHPQYAYLPFGIGPRNCLGMRFALLEIKVCLANLLRQYRLKPHSSTKVPLEYKKGLVLLTVTELPLMLEKRMDVK
ncbi:Cytochrome P450 3A11 like protein [Argiope bruennichi]|uniref:Cytochrome P450 3A11 like protein n=1 Tax=Argiope bruennichi TaxID=94029 RepID=A0A8T0EHL6_ARGBR|nr:Cytochrome P450 3A11 like protein [Argiope bruennichi]